jgi:hypothetical protein
MPLLIIIPFVIFACCCLVQFVFLRRVRAALAERHPDVWLKISTKAWFIDSAVGRLAWTGQARSLGDPELMALINQLRVLYAVAFAAWLTLLGVMITGVGFTKY